MNNIILTEILKVNKGKFEKLTDKVIQEVSFEIRINGKRLTSISALPENLIELGIGFLYSEGLLFSANEIVDYTFFENKNLINFNLNIPKNRIESFYKTGEKTSGCGSSLSAALTHFEKEDFAQIALKHQEVSDLIRIFQKNSKLFYETGGVHSCALVKDYKIKFYAEDIGRHNAVDKVIGMAKLKNYPLGECFLVSSGRISSEIVKKSVRVNIPLIISQSATTSEAINLAWKYKIYLIGFARADRFNIYTGFNKLNFI